jgi:hypothetical protein
VSVIELVLGGLALCGLLVALAAWSLIVLVTMHDGEGE